MKNDDSSDNYSVIGGQQELMPPDYNARRRPTIGVAWS